MSAERIEPGEFYGEQIMMYLFEQEENMSSMASLSWQLDMSPEEFAVGLEWLSRKGYIETDSLFNGFDEEDPQRLH